MADPRPSRPPPRPRSPARPWGTLRTRRALLVLLPLVAGRSASRSAASAGTRAVRTSSASPATEVVIYKGVPGGVLGWNPTVDQRTGSPSTQLTQLDHDRVRRATRAGRWRRRGVVRRRGSRRRRRDHDDDHDDDHRPTTTTTTVAKPPRPTTTTARTRLADHGPRAARPPAPPRRAFARPARRDHRRSAATSSSRSPTGRRCRPTSTRCSRGCSASTSSRTSRSGASRRTPTRRCCPLAALLNGIGFVVIARLDVNTTTGQRACSRSGSRSGSACSCSRWSSCATSASSSATATRCCCSASAFAALPLAAGHRPHDQRRRASGSAFGSLTFEPSEIAKVLLVAFFAAYLVDKRELLDAGPRPQSGRCFLPSLRDLGPLLLAWGLALLVLVYEKTSARRCCSSACSRRCSTSRPGAAAYLLGTLVLLAIGSYLGVPRVRPRARARRELDRPVEGRARAPASRSSRRRYAFGSGGIAGTGLGLGTPASSRTRRPTSCSRRSVKSSGSSARIGVVAAFMLLVGSAFRIAADATRPFSKLFAAGIATILGFQTFLIIGGVTRVDPAHRHHAAVRVVRRLVARRQLRADRDPAAHLRRHRANARERTQHVNVGIRRVGIAIIVLFLGLVGAAHVSAGRATAASSPTTRTTRASSSATSAGRADRS